MPRDQRPAFAAVAVAASITLVAAWVALREPPSSAADRAGFVPAPAPAAPVPVVSMAPAPPLESPVVEAPTATAAGSTPPATDAPGPAAATSHLAGERELTIVVTANGAPVAGARLRFPSGQPAPGEDPFELLRVTDRAGEARYGLIKPGREDAHVGLLVEAPGHATEVRVVRLGPDGARVSIELGPDRPVTGRVVDAAGRPVPRAKLRARRWTEDALVMDASTALATTDDRGVFVVRGLAADVPYRVWVTPPAPHLASSFWITSAQVEDVVLELGGSVRVEVTYPPELAPDLLGAPEDERVRSQFRARWFTERLHLQVRPAADAPWKGVLLPSTMEVADEGRIVLRYAAVPPGELFFSLETDVFGPVTVQGGAESRVVGRRAPARRIDLRLVDRAGLPLRGGAAWLLDGWAGGGVQTGRDGRGSLACPAEREVRVELRAEGYRPRTLDAPPGVTALGEVVLEEE